MQSTSLTQQLRTIAAILLGNAIYALSIVVFILPGGLITGGTTGIGLFIHHQFHIPISWFVYAFNVAMLVLGWIFMGRRFALNTILSSLFFHFILSIFEKFPALQSLKLDLFMSAVFGGALIGIGIGIVLREGASTGGMDIPPILLHKFFGIPIGGSMYVFDCCILILQGVVSTPEQILYGIAVVITYTLVLNKVLLSGKSQTQVKIISQHYQEINQAIQQTLDRGSTLVHSRTGHMGADTYMVLTVISNRELVKLNRMVMNIDPQAFMIINQVNEVKGRGFTLGKRPTDPPIQNGF